MDGFRQWLAGRVGLRLVVLLALLWGGTSAGPGMTGASTVQPAVRPAAGLQPVILGHYAHAVQPAARHAQRSRGGFGPVVVLAAVLAGALVATIRRKLVCRPGCLEGRLLAARPRAPPSRPL